MMKELIQKTIALLKLQVKTNLDLINQNQVKIKEILQDPASNERSMNFEKHYEVNKNLLAENNDFINVQLTLINFLEKYKNSPLLQNNAHTIDFDSINDPEEMFTLTVDGALPFDNEHPLYDDADFFNRLMDYYKSNEQYEKCQQLQRLKRI